jgi:hypothetical protein
VADKGALDQGFKHVKAKLRTTSSPFDPWTGRGDKLDPAQYIVKPGVNFMRPWIAIRGGDAFQWPVGLEGYRTVVDPSLGIHRFIGDNAVVVDVMHAGEEHFSMTGSFPGDSAPDLIKALKAVVYAKSTDEGKILWLPEIVSYAQRVHVANAEFSRDEDARGRDARYSIEFVVIGHTSLSLDPEPEPTASPPFQNNKGRAPRHFKVNSKYNTLRKIATRIYKDAKKWHLLYNANEGYFVKNKIPLSKAPTYKLPNGLSLIY